MTKRISWLLAAVLAVVCITYTNHFHNSFHFDDSHTVVDNPYIRDISNLPRFFKDTTMFSVLPSNRTYRPFVSASLAIDYWLGRGYSLFFFHLSTFLIFLLQLTLMAVLFNAILEKCSPGTNLQNRLTALAAVAWYGLHPAIAETVNYVIQRGDVFAAAGVVAALALFVSFPRLRILQIYLLPFVFALLSKPPALVFPVLLLCYLLLFESSEANSRAARWRRAALQIVPALIVCVLLLLLQKSFTPKSYTPSILSPSAYRITQPYVWLRYCFSLFLPIHLNVDTDLGTLALSDPRAWIGFAFVAALLVLVKLTLEKPAHRPIAFGILWFVFAQLPTSLYPLSEVENDHRMYFAFIGLILAVVQAAALGLQALFIYIYRSKPNEIGDRWRRIAAALIVLLLLCYARGTYARNQVWLSEETLWRDDVEKSPHNGRGLMNYGLVLMARGAYQPALELFTQALRYTPNYPTLEINLGVVNDALGRGSEAEHHFQRALALAPNADEAHFFYGRSLFKQHRLSEARTQIERGIALNPTKLDPEHLLIQIDLALGDHAAAKAAAVATLRLAPDDTDAKDLLAHPKTPTVSDWIELSLSQYQQGQFELCEQSARRALELQPGSAEAWNNIAAAEASLKHWDKAIEAGEQALHLKPDFQLAKNNLAWAVSEKKKQ